MVAWQNSPSTSTPINAENLAAAFAEKTAPADVDAKIATQHTTDNSTYRPVSPASVIGPMLAGTSNWNAPAANRVALTRVEVTQTVTIHGIGLAVVTASGNICCAVYAADGPQGAAYTRLGTSGSVACPAAGNRTIGLSANLTLTPGAYWLAVEANNAVFVFNSTTLGGVYAVLPVGLAAFTDVGVFPAPATLGIIFTGRTYSSIPALYGLPTFTGPVPLGTDLGLTVARAGDSNTFVDPYFEINAQTLSSAYSYSLPNTTHRTTMSGIVTVEASYVGADQPPNWLAIEIPHVGIGYFTTVNDNYLAMISQTANQFQVIKQVGGVETVLAKRDLTGKVTLAQGAQYRIDIKADGVNVTATLLTTTGTVIDTVTVADTAFTSGYPGFHIYAAKGRLYSLTVNP